MKTRTASRGTLRVSILLLALVAVTAVGAQSTGGLSIQVLDDDGPLPGATVTISNDERRIATATVSTDTRGRAEFPVLPPGGGYQVEVSFPGYGTVRLDELRVKTNANPVISVHLSEKYTERVRSIAERDVVDLEKTSQSTKFSDEFIHDLPVPGRFYQNILTLAPGVQDANNDGNPNVHGSRARDFRAMVGGVANVDPLTGTFRSNVNPNSIEEIEVITAGAGPEYGRAQGGFANIIQKQGSNRFEGVFDFIHRTSALDGNGASNVRDARVPDFDWFQPSLQFSGPIVRDRLWFRLSHEWIDREDPVNTIAALEVVTNKQQINSDQLTWQVSNRNKLAFKFDANPVDIIHFGVSSLTPASSSQIRSLEADTYSVVWSAAHSPRIYVESIAAWQDGGFSILPSQRGLGNSCLSGPPFIEDAFCNDQDGRNSGSFWLDFEDHRQRFTVRSDATIYAKKRLLGMNHQFKFGFIVENERYVRDIVERPRIDFFIFRPNFTGPVRLDPIGIALVSVSVPLEQRARATGASWGLYVKDQIKPRENLTIEIGARLERETIDSQGRSSFDPVAEFETYQELFAEHVAAGLPPHVAARNARIQAFTAFESIETMKKLLGQVFELSPQVFGRFFGPITGQGAFQERFRRPVDIHLVNTNVSPFLAATWDPWSNGKTKLAFAAGRHYNNIPLIVPTQELAPATTTVEFRAERSGGGWRIDDVTRIRGSINPTASVQVVDRGLRTPYQDEFTLSFQRELWAETAVALTYVKREYRDQLQDVDINHVPGDFGRCVLAEGPGDPALDPSGGPDGILDDCTGEQVPVGVHPLTGRTMYVDRPDGVPDLYTMNPFWGPIYQIGNSNEADYEAFVLELVRRQYRGWELQGSYTWSIARGNGEDFDQFLGDDQSTLEDEQGFQSTDQRHVVKLAATTVTPWGIRLGGTATWQSGLPYSVLAQDLSFDSIPPQFAGFGGFEPRNRIVYTSGVRNDRRNRSYWDFNLKATREFSFPSGINVQLSAEIFNLLNDGTYTIYNPFLETGRQLNGSNDAFRRFGRRFQLGLRLAF